MLAVLPAASRAFEAGLPALIELVRSEEFVEACLHKQPSCRKSAKHAIGVNPCHLVVQYIAAMRERAAEQVALRCRAIRRLAA